jgi:hypothetical protein
VLGAPKQSVPGTALGATADDAVGSLDHEFPLSGGAWGLDEEVARLDWEDAQVTIAVERMCAPGTDALAINLVSPVLGVGGVGNSSLRCSTGMCRDRSFRWLVGWAGDLLASAGAMDASACRTPITFRRTVSSGMMDMAVPFGFSAPVGGLDCDGPICRKRAGPYSVTALPAGRTR